MDPDKVKKIMLIPSDLERTCIYLATDQQRLVGSCSQKENPFSVGLMEETQLAHSGNQSENKISPDRELHHLILIVIQIN